MLQASLLERDGGCCQPAEVYKESAKCNDGDKLNIQFVCIQSAFVLSYFSRSVTVSNTPGSGWYQV